MIAKLAKNISLKESSHVTHSWSNIIVIVVGPSPANVYFEINIPNVVNPTRHGQKVT